MRLRGTVFSFGIVIMARLSGVHVQARSLTAAVLLLAAFGREAENVR
jgi:hypothetical protein